jgi:hypothetical protein
LWYGARLTRHKTGAEDADEQANQHRIGNAGEVLNRPSGGGGEDGDRDPLR